MITYENSYFKIRINFPSDWKVRSRSNTEPAPPINYQLADDDLPRENDEFRTLFFACRRDEGTPNIFNSNFSVVVHKHINGYDLLAHTKQKSDLIECESELSQVLGRDAQVVKLVQSGSDYNCITKIVAWEEAPEIWFSVYCGGNSLQNFQVAEDILKCIVRI